MNKQHIIDEIKRTAQANGGRPLGRARFFEATGIKESDWSGRYWARWGEAVAEAGFAPNELKSAFSEERIMSQFVDLIHELGRFPTISELRLKRRRDPTFPNDKVFANRFGSKSQLASKIVDYCRSKGGLSDVISLCEGVRELEESTTTEPDASRDPFGFVYLLKSGRYYKIGKTNAFGRRERELAIQLPEKVRTVHIIKTDDPDGIEAYWHKRFEPKRANGEWFELDSSEVTAFKRRKFM